MTKSQENLLIKFIFALNSNLHAYLRSFNMQTFVIEQIYFCRFAHPITYGDYPQSMRSSVGDRLPKFTKEQSQNLKGSYDFIGVNYYTSYYAESAAPTSINKTYYTDMQAHLSRKYYRKLL